jgi:hypothetical protein
MKDFSRAIEIVGNVYDLVTGSHFSVPAERVPGKYPCIRLVR